ARTGRRMRVATKYLMQTRSFFARHGVADYRITESSRATEGAPAAGAAELIVDITTTGATLVANGLKILGDGVILKSQAQLAASLRATWSDSQLAVAERLLRVIEARATAHDSATLVWPDSEGDEDLIGDLVAAGATRRPNGVLAPVDRIAAISTLLTAKGRGPVTASRPDFVFETSCGPYEALAQRVKN
ncbi:MAG: ATP phosphoribosyltransferase, partial [Phenylobacterium sp.]|nr:ATP phosphoribosyltransferase [Phenylobacterium sp.]